MDKTFWDNVYQSKAENGVSWYQEFPSTSLAVIDSLNLSPTSTIIDVGGGRSKLAEQLCDRGFKDISVLDISEVALTKMRDSLNQNFPKNKVETFCTNITEAQFNKKFDLWHDRAVFHFLTSPSDQQKYVDLLMKSLNPKGYFLISTFSKNGPKKCSGLDICQYDRDDLVAMFPGLTLIESKTFDHQTPFNTIQNFSCCLFQKL